jgi:hypothetical protein
MLMFIDEAAKNDRTTARTKGWSLLGTRCIQRRAFVRGKRFSILPVLTLDGIIAHDVIEGSVNTERFLSFLEEHVVRFFVGCSSIFANFWHPDSSHQSLPRPTQCSCSRQL